MRTGSRIAVALVVAGLCTAQTAPVSAQAQLDGPPNAPAYVPAKRDPAKPTPAKPRAAKPETGRTDAAKVAPGNTETARTPAAKSPAAKPDLARPEPAQPQEAPVPYEPALLRLSEIMGALAYLRDLCGVRDGEDWRSRMAGLIEAEGTTEARRERLAGAFNRGFRGYQTTYRACTGNARQVISRYIDEGSRIARDVTSRYGGG